jgi:NADH dehydrogenase
MKKDKKTRVVIVGGGFGGVKAALQLANKPGFEVVLISQGNNFEYHGALYRSATGNSPMEVVIPIKDILHRAKNVTFVLDKVISIDPKNNTVKSEVSNTYKYDQLILAMGNVINYFGIDGMDQNSYGLSTIAETIMLRNKMTELFKQGKPPTIAIVGAGPSGVELAGEIQHFARRISRKYKTHVVHPKVVLIEGADRVLPMFDPVLAARAYVRLQELGVEVRLNTKVNSCEEGKVCLSSGDVMADLIIWTAGSRAVDFYANNSKCFEMERGRVKVDEFMRAEGNHNIFVIGDNAFTRFSGMAQTALHDAKFVSRNLLRIHNGKEPVDYRMAHPTYVVPVGDKWAVLQNDKHKLSGSRAWLMRRRADLWVFRNFEPYKKAVKTWRKGNSLADF